MMKKISFALLLLLLAAFKAEPNGGDCDRAYSADNFSLAFKLCKPLADKGVAGAQLFVAQMYYLGQGMQKNAQEGVLWFKKAASHPNLTSPPAPKAARTQRMVIRQIAEYNLSQAYYKGKGTEKDPKQGFEWLKKSAEDGFEGAQYDLACKYFQGEGGDNNKGAAFEWAERAANQGNHKAQVLIVNFEDEKANWVNAYKWYVLASKNDSESLSELHKKLLAYYSVELPLKMTTEQITQGRDLAAEWKPKKEALYIQ